MTRDWLLLAAAIVLAAFVARDLIRAASAAPYTITATLCATPDRTDCTTASWRVEPRPGESEPWCDGSGPLNRIITIVPRLVPGRSVVLVPGSITCARAS